MTADTFPLFSRYSLTAVNEMLSVAACLKGLSLAQKSSGDVHTYREALETLLSSVRCRQSTCWSTPWAVTSSSVTLLGKSFFVGHASSAWSLCFCPGCDLIFPLVLSFAESAENPALCVAAVRHYWNTCQPLTQSPEERWQLQEPLEKILMALEHASMKHASVWSLSHFSL